MLTWTIIIMSKGCGELNNSGDFLLCQMVNHNIVNFCICLNVKFSQE